MKNLRRVIGMYFQKVSPYNILNGDIHYANFDKRHFDAIAKEALPWLSDTDTDELYLYLKQTIEDGNDGLNVFTALKIISNEYLMIRNNKPICSYNKILKWRKLVKSVGEDLPVCAFLAYRTRKTGYQWNDFEWDTVIGNDNMQLNRILQRGISDNHFHLFGSAPIFQLVWIKLMNQITGKKYIKELKSIDRDKRNTRKHYVSEYQEESLEQMRFQAALIRMILFVYIHNIKISNWGISTEQQLDMRSVIVEKQREIEAVLQSKFSMEVWEMRLQNDIDSLKLLKKAKYDEDDSDYANLEQNKKSINHEFAGERALIYQMLCGQVDRQKIPDFLMNLFYVYLTIQIKFREELVQVNETIGFENFLEYSKRKGKFFSDLLGNRKMIQHAVKGSFEPGNLKSLEIRMTPELTAKGNRDWIKFCDDVIWKCRQERQGHDIRQNIEKKEKLDFYYVLHFPKKTDVKLEAEEGIVDTCRHQKFRNTLKKQYIALMEFREKYPEEAGRVLGIDACSQEIDCRPEVFAMVFQGLTNHVARKPYNVQVKQWKITYHVGEDGRDFVDGLRAIDEAIRFLNMKNGDRLGHATFLGLDVKTWYEEKRKTVYLPLQDYLDNVVWIYHKLIEFDIKDCETLKGHLLAEYEHCFNMLYAESLQETKLSYGIYTYYEAWKHRDVDPETYKSKEYRQIGYAPWIESTNEYVKEGRWYEKKEIIYLLYYYHYSADIRCKRNVIKKEVVPQIYINGVEKIQKAMQQLISEKGICVESNPSSNLLISSMKRYDEHPILNLYNFGLTMDFEELKNCPQIHVSINTDDKGVFYTSLENEYALMGRALEKMADEDGSLKYHKQMIYDWIEHIRQNGNQQSFLKKVDENI